MSVYFRLLHHDVISGLRQNKYKYCIAALTVFVLCLSFYMLSQDIWLDSSPNGLHQYSGERSISDYFIFLSKGMEVYVPSTDNPFKFPIFWAIIQIQVALLVATYPANDLEGYSRNVFIRTENKLVWWCAKITWTVLTVVSFYLLGFIVVVMCSLIVGDTAFFPTSNISLHVNGIDACALLPSELFGALAVGVLASVVLATIQVVLSFVVKPAFSFVVIMTYTIASTYFHAPYLIADYSMLLRNGMLLPEGLDNMTMIVICLILALTSSIAGYLYFARRDII